MTVRDLKNLVLREAGVRHHFAFRELSPGHRDLWVRLHLLGMRGIPPRGEDHPPDVDAAAVLTDLEVEEIQAALRSLSGGAR